MRDTIRNWFHWLWKLRMSRRCACLRNARRDCVRAHEVEKKSWRPEAAERNEIGLCLISILLKRRRSAKIKRRMSKTTSKVSVDKNSSFTRFVLFTKTISVERPHTMHSIPGHDKSRSGSLVILWVLTFSCNWALYFFLSFELSILLSRFRNTFVSYATVKVLNRLIKLLLFTFCVLAGACLLTYLSNQKEILRLILLLKRRRIILK